MDELKQAYKIMGLPEFASKEEVEKRYTTLMRRDRARSKLAPDKLQEGNENQEDFAQITAAFRQILEYEDRKVTDAFNEQEYGKYKKLSGQAQKFDHFWRYYRIHTFAAIAAVALIIYGIFAYIDHREEQRYLASLPPIDLSVTLMGGFMLEDGSSDYEQINSSLLASFPEWKRFDSSIIYVPQDQASQMAYLQKAVVLLATEIPDIYIMDEGMFNWVGQNSAFLSLDDDPTLAPLLNDEIALKQKTQDDPTERIYGVDLTDSKLADDLPTYPQKLIVGIRINAKNPDKAKEFIRAYAETIP